MSETTALESIRLKPEDLQFFNRQIASMARLNMPIAKGLRILARDVQDPAFRRLIEAIQQDLDEGVSLQDALSKFPNAFSSLQLEVIRAGESSGNLAVILDELNAHTEAMKRIRSRIIEAVTYPAVISTVIFAFIVFFLYVVAPQFEEMLGKRSVAVSGEGAGIDPLEPFPLTRALFALSHLVNNKVALFLLVGGFIAVVVLGFQRLIRMGEEYDDMLFNLPMFGRLFERAALMKVTRTMRDLLQSGVSMVEALRLTARTVGRNRIQRKLDELRLAVEEGGSFSRNLAGGDVFPDTMVWKLQMAEEKGIIEQALGELAVEFEVSVDEQTTLITKLLAPILLVGMGGVVFLMFFACFVPLTNIYGS